MTLGRKIFTVGMGTAAAQLIMAASTPLLTRLYQPQAHAAWAIFLSFSVVFSAIATLRYELAVVLPKEGTVAAALALAGGAMAIVFGVLASTVIWLFGARLFAPELQGYLLTWLWLMPISVVSTALYQLSVAWCTRQAAFKTYSLAQFLLPMVILGAQLICALMGKTAAGLIVGSVVGQLVVAMLLVAIVLSRNLDVFTGAADRRTILAAARQYRQYPCYMTPYTLVGQSRDRMAYFFLGRLGTAAAAGYYGLAARLVNLPNSFISSAVRPVFFQHAAGRDPRTMEGPVLQTVRNLGLITTICWIPCATHAAWLFGLLFGEAWSNAAPYAIALSLPAIPLVMGNWADRLFDVLGRQRTAFVMEISFSFLAITGLFVGYTLSGDLFVAVCAQSAVLTLYYVTWLAVLFKAAGFSVVNLCKSFVEIFLVGAVGWAICAATARWLPPAVAFGLSGALALGLAGWLGRQAWRKLNSREKPGAGDVSD